MSIGEYIKDCNQKFKWFMADNSETDKSVKAFKNYLVKMASVNCG